VIKLGNSNNKKITLREALDKYNISVPELAQKLNCNAGLLYQYKRTDHMYPHKEMRDKLLKWEPNLLIEKRDSKILFGDILNFDYNNKEEWPADTVIGYVSENWQTYNSIEKLCEVLGISYDVEVDFDDEDDTSTDMKQYILGEAELSECVKFRLAMHGISSFPEIDCDIYGRYFPKRGIDYAEAYLKKLKRSFWINGKGCLTKVEYPDMIRLTAYLRKHDFTYRLSRNANSYEIHYRKGRK
jgi:hypothetical protein